MITKQTITVENRLLIEKYCLHKGIKTDLASGGYTTNIGLATAIRSEMTFRINATIRFINRGKMAQIEFETSNRLQIQGAIMAFILFTVVLFLI